MFEIQLNVYQSAAMGALILVLGIILVKHSPTLRKFCIPAAVAGGLLFSLVNTGFHYADVTEFTFDDTLKNFFMMMFFCSIGFTASFRMLKSGGKFVLLLLALVSVVLVIQDLVGVSIASAFGMDPKLGLCLGSISLTGGHGTAASYGQLLAEEYGITSATTVAVAAATFGLAVSGFIGGPLARKRIEQYDLKPDEEDIELAQEEEVPRMVDNQHFLHSLILMIVCIGIGSFLVTDLKGLGITVPVYLGAMIFALIIRNVADCYSIVLPIREIVTLGTICLSMFLAMALMEMKLWQLTDLAAAMVITLLLQTVIVALFAYFIIFKATGSNYDSAAYTTASCGFLLGATPNAMANMDALFEEHGKAPAAYFVVPLVGSVFIDFINTGVLTVFLGIL
ncbi:MAG: sodium/glutamate symporter [Candidatus Methanomethylophilus sp.]|nr:sodium/glutamate symporter [Methanomethylophilus sp.]